MAADRRGSVRFFCHDDALTRWEVLRDVPGRMRLRNGRLRRRSSLCRAVERELRGVLGIESFRVHARTGEIRVDYDPAQLEGRDIIDLLEGALAGAAGPRDSLDLQLPLSTASVPIAAVAQFAVPALLPAAAALLAYTAIPTVRRAYRSLVRERRPGPEVLDSAVVLGCLGTMSVFPGALLCWGLGVGRALAARTQDHSRRLLLDGFGRRPFRARFVGEDVERLVPSNSLRKGELIVVDAGEVVPADGRIVAGRAMIDLSALAAGSSPAEKAAGDRVLAATLVMGGRVYVAVEAVGEGTAAGRIGRILDEAADYRPSAQQAADRLALPALAIGAAGLATMGPAVGLAVANRDFASGPRLSAPPAMVAALALCAHRGILVKDARALDRMAAVDAVLIDTGALSTAGQAELPEVIDGLRERGIVHAGILSADGADVVACLRAEGRTVCLVGDSGAVSGADVSISLRGPESLADDPAGIIFLEPGLGKLGDLLDISGDLDRSLRHGRAMTLAANGAGLVGIVTVGLGLMGSVVINQMAALLALGRAVGPLRQAAQMEAERRHRQQMARVVAAGVAAPAQPEKPPRPISVSGPMQLASP